MGLRAQVEDELRPRRDPASLHVPSGAVVACRLEPDEVGHRAARGDQAPGSVRQAEDVGGEPAGQGQLDLGGRRRELPPADVHVEPRSEQVGGGARHRARAGDVGDEPGVAGERRLPEDELPEVGEELVVCHGIIRHRDGDRVPDLVDGPASSDRELREPLEQLGPEVDHAPAELGGALGAPGQVRLGSGRGGHVNLHPVRCDHRAGTSPRGMPRGGRLDRTPRGARLSGSRGAQELAS